MFRMKSIHAVVLALAAGLSAGGHAASTWDEASRGDLSNDRLNPTALVMAAGDNTVLGTVGNAGSGVDRDYFKFQVPTGFELQAIVLLGNSAVSGASAFIALQDGPQMLTTPGGAGIEHLLGQLHYEPHMVGQDLLALMAARFSGALPAGTYTAWVQETGGVVPYGLNFVMAPVPEPGAGTLWLAGLAAGGIWARRRMPRGGLMSPSACA